MVNLYTWLTISSSFGSMSLTLRLIDRNDSLNFLCHGCGFACQQGVLKTFPFSVYLYFEDAVFRLWHSVVNFIYGSPFHLPTAQSLRP